MGLGTESTQIRVNRLLRKEVSELPQSEIEEALCYTPAYMGLYIETRGEIKEIPKKVLPSGGKARFKDLDWWLESEKKNMNFSCKEPWA